MVQGRNLLRQRIRLGTARVRHRPRHGHSPGSTSPVLPWSWDGKTTARDGAGRASAPARPASSPSCMRNWERKLESQPVLCGRMGQAVSDANQGFESARRTALGSSPFALLGIATALVNSPSPRRAGCRPWDVLPPGQGPQRWLMPSGKQTKSMGKLALLPSWEFNNHPMQQHGPGETSGTAVAPKSAPRSQLLPC